MRLDLVAKLSEGRPTGQEVSKPKLIIIEIANRVRPPRTDQFDTSYEARSVTRFKEISRAIGSREDSSILFLIRFLDVSADQAHARALREINVRDRVQLERELVSVQAKLDAAEGLDNVTRGLNLAWAWARWLRIMANRFPARRGELKRSDLRTVQKDLFDGGIISLTPSQYFIPHQNLMAIFEGGDVSWEKIEQLRRPLHQLLKYVETTVLSTSSGSMDAEEDRQ
jgi:hypothetical protein